MLTSHKKEFLAAFARRVGDDCIDIADDFSSAMIFSEHNSQFLDTFIHFAEDGDRKPTVTLEFSIVTGDDLPVTEIAYSMHVINYAATRKQGIPNFFLSLRPSVKGENGSASLPLAVVMTVSKYVAGLKERDLIALFESRIQQAFEVKKAMLTLIESANATNDI
jgi:hypothetical protein